MNKIFLILFVLLLPHNLYGDEPITDFDSHSVPVLNEELRKLDVTNKALENRVETNETDIGTLQDFYSGTTSSNLTIASGVVTVTQAVHSIETEAAGATDDLDTISGGSASNILTVYAYDSSHTVVLKDGTGNLKLSGDCTLDNTEDTATLIKIGSNWQLLNCTNNGA